MKLSEVRAEWGDCWIREQQHILWLKSDSERQVLPRFAWKKPCFLSPRYLHPDPPSPLLESVRGQIESQSRCLLLRRARDAIEPLEEARLLFNWNALSLILDLDRHFFFRDLHAHRNRRCCCSIFDRVGQQVHKEPLKARGFDRGQSRCRIDPAPSARQGGGIGISRKKLDGERESTLFQKLEQADGQRVDFFAGGAAGNPDPEHGSRRKLMHHDGKRVPGQGGEDCLVAEKAGHRDEHFLSERLAFRRVGLQIVRIGREVCDLQRGHAVQNPSLERGWLTYRRENSRLFGF